MVTAERISKPAAPADPIEVREIDGQLYASSPHEGWYAVSLGDESHCPTCECRWHEKKLRGTRVFCKHLHAAARFRRRKERELVSGIERRQEVPDPEWVRGTCPACGGAVVCNAYYVGGRGYVLLWECWESLGEKPLCDYRKVL